MVLDRIGMVWYITAYWHMVSVLINMNQRERGREEGVEEEEENKEEEGQESCC